MTAFYNEIDRGAAAWLRELAKEGHISNGVVDERSIAELQPEDISNYRRVHLFAGVAGWELALRIAGWPEDLPVWTGSCPCQPFSAAGKRKGQADERHLWPEMFRLIDAIRPPCIMGEQVPGAIKPGWLDGVFTDLEGAGYACGAVVLGAHSAGAPHIRQRIYWVAYAESANGRPEPERGSVASGCGTERVGDTQGQGPQGRPDQCDTPQRQWEAAGRSAGFSGGIDDATASMDSVPVRVRELLVHDSPDSRPRLPMPADRGMGDRSLFDAWSDYRLIHFRDGKTRRIESSIEPLVNGIPGRVGLLRRYGNAIVPQAAAIFIRAVMEELGI